jgi:phosphatidylserine/phosphatidylglycerophosphate/cardiolipin synthase-like enzyme
VLRPRFDRVPLRRDGVRLTSPSAFAVPDEQAGEEHHDWLLTDSQRGNPATRLRAWTQGNAVRPLVHGRAYFERLAEVVEAAGRGDLLLFADWRGDPGQKLRDDGLTVSQLLCEAAQRGVIVRGLIWRSHMDRFEFSHEQNRNLAEGVNEHGGEVLLDQRVRPFGSHHQKFVVVRHRSRPADDVAFVGGLDLAHSRRDDADHHGDEQPQGFSRWYGDTPAWHDVQVEIHGPAVRDVEDVFRERWADRSALSRLPWHAIPDLARKLDRNGDRLPAQHPDPPRAGTASVQLLRTYPNRWPGYPFAPDGERSAARGYAKAMQRARRLVYIEDQYLWSEPVARVFADALRREPDLHLVAVVPRYPDQDGALAVAASRHGHAVALDMVQEAGGDRVLVLDVENHANLPVYVHAKVCVVDDVWATVGSDNFNRRSWTHDSELTAAVVDEARDPREPRDPGGLGDGARVFARELRLTLLREHLDLAPPDDDVLLDPAETVATIRRRAEALQAWHERGREGPRPPGRLRPHDPDGVPRWRRLLVAPAYRAVADPDGRPPRMKVHRRH